MSTRSLDIGPQQASDEYSMEVTCANCGHRYFETFKKGQLALRFHCPNCECITNNPWTKAYT
jgi:transcription elongation factor Elf1